MVPHPTIEAMTLISHPFRTVFVALTLLNCVSVDAKTPTQWHGFARHDFELEGRKCYIVKPSQPAQGRPWVWRARFPNYHPEVDAILLERGFHVAHIDTGGMLGCEKALDHWDQFYEHMTGPAVWAGGEGCSGGRQPGRAVRLSLGCPKPGKGRLHLCRHAGL